MATFTSKAPGPWSSAGQTTWNEVGVPGSGDTATLSHAITGDTDISINTLNMSTGGHLTMNAGKLLKPRVQVNQGNAIFTLSAGAGILADTTLGNVKWLQGTADSQTNCKIVANGTIGAHVTIGKTGSNSFWFDGGNDGAIVNCGGWDMTYCDFDGLGHNSLAWSIRSSDFGLHHRRFLNCTFNNCKTQFEVVYQWGGNGNCDWRVEHCTWTNQPAGAMGMRFYNSYSGTGLKTFIDCRVGEPADANFCMTLACKDALVEDCYFDSCPSMVGAPNCTPVRCTVRESANTQTLTPYGGLVDTYILADHVDPADRVNGTTHVGNPHFLQQTATLAPVFSGLVFEYPHAQLIDGGDGIFGQDGTSGGLGAAIIKNCLVLPSMTDGVAGTNLHAMTTNDTNMKLLHNTVVGKIAQLSFNERNTIGLTCVAECKSNLVAGVSISTSPAEWGALFYDLNGDTLAQVDNMVPAGIQYNYMFMPIPDNTLPSVPGDAQGIHARLSAPPDATNIYEIGGLGAEFVDATRNAASWAVHKGAASSGDTKRVKLDAVRTLLMGDPTLGYGDLLPWVRAGFLPQKPSLINAGHDGFTIGAIQDGGGGEIPPPTTNKTGRIGKGGHGRARRS